MYALPRLTVPLTSPTTVRLPGATGLREVPSPIPPPEVRRPLTTAAGEVPGDGRAHTSALEPPEDCGYHGVSQFTPSARGYLAGGACPGRTIHTTATLQPGGALVIRLPFDLPIGAHRVALTVDDCPAPSVPRAAVSELPKHDLGPWPDRLSLRREDLYGDTGR